MLRLSVTVAACAALAGFPAAAGEVLGGIYAHDVTFIGDAFGVGSAGREDGDGVDVQLGLRSGRIDWLSLLAGPQAHVIVSLNTRGFSNFAAAGLSWPIALGHRFYFRPGLGLALTDGKAELAPVNAPGLTPTQIADRLDAYQHRIDFGSHLLFEPELAFGAHLGPRWDTELSWVHLSNGQIFHHGKNQGLDDVGLRLVYRFGPQR